MSTYTSIAAEVVQEVARSTEKHGDQRDLPMGTGPGEFPLELASGAPVDDSVAADELADIFTVDTKAHSRNEGGDDTCTWWLILREEVFEAAAEDDPEKLRAEMVQVAAVALKIIDAIDNGGN